MCKISGEWGKDLPRWFKDAQCANELCLKALVQREGEPNYNYIKRATCDRTCGALARRQRQDREAQERIKTQAEILSVKIYTPGTEEFEMIARLYR